VVTFPGTKVPSMSMPSGGVRWGNGATREGRIRRSESKLRIAGNRLSRMTASRYASEPTEV